MHLMHRIRQKLRVKFQPGGQFLTHYIEMKAQIMSSHYLKTMIKTAILQICSKCIITGGSYRLLIHRSGKTMKTKATHSTSILVDCVSVMSQPTRAQHAKCHNYVMAQANDPPCSLSQYCDDTCMWSTWVVLQLCNGTYMLFTMLRVTILWWYMQVISMRDVLSLMTHACNPEGSVSCFLEKIPLHIKLKSGR
jgi:hypothetical protein